VLRSFGVYASSMHTVTRKLSVSLCVFRAPLLVILAEIQLMVQKGISGVLSYGFKAEILDFFK
jgi:hypothetical protein